MFFRAFGNRRRASFVEARLVNSLCGSFGARGSNGHRLSLAAEQMIEALPDKSAIDPDPAQRENATLASCLPRRLNRNTRSTRLQSLRVS